MPCVTVSPCVILNSQPSIQTMVPDTFLPSHSRKEAKEDARGSPAKSLAQAAQADNSV